jgi:hypothetical protein
MNADGRPDFGLVRFRYLARILPAKSNAEDPYTSVKRIVSDLGVQATNPKRASYGALEVDLFAPSRGDVELALAALEPVGRIEFVKDLGEPAHHLTADEAVREARILFNAERYWESHEVLEGAWRSQEGDEKQFLQGLILVCAAMVHHQRAEDETGLGILKRAERQLAFREGFYRGVDVARLRGHVSKALENGALEPFQI